MAELWSKGHEKNWHLRSSPEQSRQTFFHVFTTHAIVDPALLFDALGAPAWWGIGVHLDKFTLMA